MDIKRPCYFLVDMGNWTVVNNVVKTSVEMEPDSSVYNNT